MAHNAYKFRLNPTKDQEDILINWCGMSRWIWNWAVETNQKQYAIDGKFVFRFQLNSRLPGLKKQYLWLLDIPAQALQNRIIDFEHALKKCFKHSTNRGGFPKFKSKRDETSNTFRICKTGEDIKPRVKRIKIPKLGWVNWIRHRPISGTLKNITIKQENGFWWCICMCEVPDAEIVKDADVSDVVGIDLGLKEFAITCDGEVFDTPKFYRKKQKKLARAQRAHSRKKKGSKNREKAIKRLNRIHYKIKCQRHDFTHKISTQITKEYLFVAMEDLNIAGMKKNRSLAKAISDQGWAMFVNQVEYKTKRNGGSLVKIDRFAPSSKTCSTCDHVQPMPLSVRTYECSACGSSIDRDINAAINIKRWGIDEINRAGTVRIHACGDITDGETSSDVSSYVLMKQEKFYTINEYGS